MENELSVNMTGYTARRLSIPNTNTNNHSNNIQRTDLDNNLEQNLNIVNNRHRRLSDNSLFALAWVNLSFFQTTLWGNKGAKILNQLRGRIDFGTLSALMGPSGCGKTTLLRCLNGANNDGLSPETEIYVSKTVPIYPCYIVQHVQEHLLMSLTVNESLNYAYKLKNRKKAPDSVRHVVTGLDSDYKKNIKALLSDLLLTDCTNNVVARCSGGEQKRLIIAMELTAEYKPNLICIDEPTSGLDSNACEQTILCLQNIARKHSLAVVTSIHQPNSEVLQMFDQLYVLAKGGRCIFCGPPYGLRYHLRSCNIECTEDQTPIEVLLKISSKKLNTFNTDEVVIELGPPEDIVSLLMKTYENMSGLKAECIAAAKRIELGGFSDNSITINPIDMYNILKRSVTYTWFRQWKLVIAQGLALVVFAFILQSIYRKDIGTDANCLSDVLMKRNLSNLIAPYVTDNETHFPMETIQAIFDSVENNENMREETLAQQNLKFLFFLCILVLFIQINATVLTFPTEIMIFLNEHRNRWYSTGSYYWVKTLIDLPILTIYAYLYCWVGYYGSHQVDTDKWYDAISNIPERFALLCMVVYLGLVCAHGLAVLAGVVFSSNYQLAAVASICLFLPNILFCGFFIPINSMPKIYKGLSYLTFLKDYFHAVLVIIYGRKRCSMSTSLILITFDVKEHNLWWKMCTILIHIIAYKVIALIVLMVKANGIKQYLASFKKLKLCFKS